MSVDVNHILTVAYSESPEAWAEWAERLPSSEVVGLRVRHSEPGYVELELGNDSLLNPNGAVNGGVIAAASDQACALALLTLLPPWWVAVTTTLNIEYRRPAMLPLVFKSRVTRYSRTLAFIEADLTGANGVVASARATLLPRAVKDFRGIDVDVPAL
ncbi:PaaI family thioesterase [Specibacter sp. RAF43]|uniref:PaaI family thioesterase n=1 Tax=Specibacter sp. RAF43 TaxID=3233057 RepID=UPI003F94B921